VLCVGIVAGLETLFYESIQVEVDGATDEDGDLGVPNEPTAPIMINIKLTTIPISPIARYLMFSSSLRSISALLCNL
jgi:hypothetical protein